MNNFKDYFNREAMVSAFVCLTVMLFVLGFYKLCNVLFALLIVEFLARVLKFGHKAIQKKELIVFLFATPLFLELFGLLWSSNFASGLKSVETKALMVILPLVLIPMKSFQLRYSWILKSFVAATIGALFIGLFDGFLKYLDTGDTGYLYSDNITYASNKLAIYASVYVNLAAVVTIYFNKKGTWSTRLTVAVIVLLLMFSFLLAARLSLLVLVVGLLLYLCYQFRHRLNLKTGLIASFVAIITLVGTIWAFPQTINRFKSVLSSFDYEFENQNPVNHFNAEVNEKNWNGLTIRLALWDCAIQQITKTPFFGTGTGDYGEELMKRYQKNNFYLAIDREFGTHNQYVYIAVAFGAFGFLALFGAYGMIIRRLYSKKFMVTLITFTIILLACLTENFLNRLPGVFLYSLLISTLFFTETEERTEDQALS